MELPITGQRLSETLDITIQYLRELARERIVVELESNIYDLLPSVRQYIQYKKNGTSKDRLGISDIELGEILGLSSRSIRELASKKIVKRISPGVYDPIESSKNYIQYLKAESENKKESEKDLLQRAKRRQAELDLMQKEGELHRAEDIRNFFADTFVPIKTGLRSIPANIGKDLAVEADENKVRAILLQEIDKTLRGLAEYPERLSDED